MAYTTFEDYVNKHGSELTESFANVKRAQEARTRMEGSKPGSSDYHMNAAMYHHQLSKHHSGLSLHYQSTGNLKKSQEENDLAHNAHQRSVHQLANFHWAKAKDHAENGNVEKSLSHQAKGDDEYNKIRHVKINTNLL